MVQNPDHIQGPECKCHQFLFSFKIFNFFTLTFQLEFFPDFELHVLGYNHNEYIGYSLDFSPIMSLDLLKRVSLNLLKLK